MTFLLTPLVLGATGRIGRSLWSRWGEEAALWQGRQAAQMRRFGRAGRLFDPLTAPDALASATAQSGQILCLAGPVPGSAGDMLDHVTLAEACVLAAARDGQRVILASSAAVYGATAGLLREELPPAPLHPYGQAKADMEARAFTLGRELGVAVTVLRIGNIAGFDAILGGWRPGFRLDQFADGRTPRRSYIGPVTLADVLKALLATPSLPPVLNIAQPDPIEMGALLQAAHRPYVTAPAPQSAIAEVALDVSRLSALLAPQRGLPAANPAEMIAEMAMLEPHIKD